jgi:hypothetical protein
VVGTLEAGASRVEYDGFLPSGAIAVTPAIQFTGSSVNASARGTFLSFESGNRSLQASVAASTFSPRVGRMRGEASVTAGASSYRDFAGFSHLLGRFRIHLLGVRRGGWVSTAFGQTSYASGGVPVTTVAAGAWIRRFPGTLLLSATTTSVGDTGYTDLETTGHWEWDTWEVEGTFGARVWSRGGGRGVYGEITTLTRLGPSLSATAGLGRYPSDPTRGSISGRYFMLGLRLAVASTPGLRRPPRTTPLVREEMESGGTWHGSSARLEIRPADSDTTRRVIIRATGLMVELAGDFTDWEPLALTSVDANTWQVIVPVHAGAHRLVIRIDGGPWLVPRGVTRVPDDFGGEVGLLVVT